MASVSGLVYLISLPSITTSPFWILFRKCKNCEFWNLGSGSFIM